MTQSVRTAIFDLDGTLHNCIIIYTRAFRKAWGKLEADGHTQPRTFTDAELQSFIGLPFVEVWSNLLPDLPKEVWLPYGKSVGDEMDRLIENGTAQLYPGVPEMLDQLKADGYNLVILSNCRVPYREKMIKRFHFDQWFTDFFAGEAYDFIPKAEIFKQYIEPAYPGDYVFVGDRYKDIEAAFATNMPCIGCTYGFGTREELERATAFADSPAEIAGIIESM